MNYYHESMGFNTTTSASILQDLLAIQTFTNRIKIYHDPYTNNGGIDPTTSLNACINITNIAKTLGMHVVWTVNVDNVGPYFTDANWPDYVSKVQADANVAQSLGIDTFCVGNEISLHNNGDPGFSDLPARIKSLIAATTFNGTVSYEMSSNELAAWVSEGMGSVQTLYLHIYSSETSFKNIATTAWNAFGNKMQIGEFSTTIAGFETDAHSDPDIWTQQLSRRTQILQNLGFTSAYYFEWRNGANNSYGLGLHRKGDVYLSGTNIALQAIIDPTARRIFTP